MNTWSAYALVVVASGALGFKASDQVRNKVRAKGTATSISLTYVPGETPDPHWIAVTIASDGKATYWSKGSRGSGTYKAEGLNKEFAAISRLIRGKSFLKLDSFYGPVGDDIPTTTVSSVIDGRRKSIADYERIFSDKHGKEAPPHLKRLEKALFKLCKETRWRKVSEKVVMPWFIPGGRWKGLGP